MLQRVGVLIIHRTKKIKQKTVNNSIELYNEQKTIKIRNG